MKLLKETKAATLIEYALIGALVAVIVVAGMMSVGNQTTIMYNTIESSAGSALQ